MNDVPSRSKFLPAHHITILNIMVRIYYCRVMESYPSLKQMYILENSNFQGRLNVFPNTFQKTVSIFSINSRHYKYRGFTPTGWGTRRKFSHVNAPAHASTRNSTSSSSSRSKLFLCCVQIKF